MGQIFSQERIDTWIPGREPIDNLHLSGYLLLAKLGEGAYGHVRMVQQKQTNKFFALKYVDKRHQLSIWKTIVEERRNLAKVRHPFICNLKYAFQEKDFFCLIIDLASASDLRNQLWQYTFSEKVIRLWIAELACAVEYLHSHNIVHRDIKPENILLNAEGHVKLADFNVARELKPERPTLSGLSGTYSYMAPEMHEEVPYTELVDWWALGIVFYECIFNQVPFRVEDRTQMSKIMKNPGLKFPELDPPVSKSCIAAIELFLQINPYERVDSTEILFESEFFYNMDRKLIEAAAEASNLPNEESNSVRPTSESVFDDIDTSVSYTKDDMLAEYPEWVERKRLEKEEMEAQEKLENSLNKSEEKENSGSENEESPDSQVQRSQVQSLKSLAPSQSTPKQVEPVKFQNLFSISSLDWGKFLARFDILRFCGINSTEDVEKEQPPSQSKEKSPEAGTSGVEEKPMSNAKKYRYLKSRFHNFDYKDPVCCSQCRDVIPISRIRDASYSNGSLTVLPKDFNTGHTANFYQIRNLVNDPPNLRSYISDTESIDAASRIERSSVCAAGVAKMSGNLGILSNTEIPKVPQENEELGKSKDLDRHTCERVLSNFSDLSNKVVA